MPVKTRSQSRNQSLDIPKDKQCQVITLPEPEHIQPIITFPMFYVKIDTMLDKINDIAILRSKTLPDTSLNRTLRFERIRLMSEMFLFIYIYFPSVYSDTSECNRAARTILDSTIELSNDLTNLKSIDNLTTLESSTINAIELALISCNKMLDFVK